MAQAVSVCCSRTICCPIAVNRGFVREACSLDTSKTLSENPRLPPLTSNALCGKQRTHLSHCLTPLRGSTFQGYHGHRSLHKKALQHPRCNAAAAHYSWLLTLPLASVGFWGEITSNVIFMAGFWGWATAQVAKIFTCYVKKGVWDVTQAVTTAIGVQHGFSSSLFAMALCFSLIVMYDAAGVRRHAGAQAEVLNTVVRELLSMHAVSQKKLKEVLGHTPLQVLMGAILGCFCGTAYTYYVGSAAFITA